MRILINKIITWLEKVLRTDVRYIFKGGFWLAIGQGVFMLNGLILAVAFANLLPKNDFGTYQYIMTVSTIAAALTLTGIGLSVRRAAARGEEGMLRYGFRVKLKWAISIFLITFATAVYYYLNENILLASSFLIISISLPFIESFRLYQKYLLGKGSFKESTTLGMWVRPLTPVAVLGTLFITQNVFILVLVFFSTTLLTTGFAYWLTVRRHKLPITRDDDAVTYGKKISVLNIIKKLANHADKIIVFQTLGASSMAVYIIAKLPSHHLQKSWGHIGKLVFPRFAQREYDDIQNSMTRKILILMALSAITCILFIAAAPFIYPFLFPQYPESVLIAQILVLTLLAKPASLVMQAFEAHKMVREQFSISISSSILKLVLIFILTNIFGIWGTVSAILLAHLYTFVISLVIFYTKSQPPSLPEDSQSIAG